MEDEMLYQPSIIETPTGRFVFVGSVPSSLAVEASEPYLIEAARQCGMALAQKIAARRGGFIRTRSFATREDAQAALDAIG